MANISLQYVEDTKTQQNFDEISRAWVAPDKYIDYGPYDTGVTPGIAPDSDYGLTVTHNLGLTSAQQAGMVLHGHVYDGSYAALVPWRIGLVTVNSVVVHFGNPSSRVGITAGLKFWLRVPPA